MPLPADPPPDPLDELLLTLEAALAPTHPTPTPPLALTGVEYAMLQLVAERGPIPLADLFPALRPARPPEMMRALEHLGAADWVMVGPEGERRIESVTITPRGVEGSRAARAWRAGVRERVLAGLTPAEREGFLAGLVKVAATLGR